MSRYARHNPESPVIHDWFAGGKRSSVSTKPMMNEIKIDAQGNCTVIGDIAHRLWDFGRGDFPRARVSANRFYVMEQDDEKPRIWNIRAAQSERRIAEEYMRANRVLVDVTFAPYI